MLGLSVGAVGQQGQKWGDELEAEAHQAPIHLSVIFCDSHGLWEVLATASFLPSTHHTSSSFG